ncbi:hypothetical protein Tco_0659323 [Tanacetum coccineum]
MSTPIDFTTFAMNRLKLDTITRAYLVGPVFKLLKDEFFFNNDLECLKVGNLEITYSSSITKTPAARRADQKLSKFKEGDFPDLHLNDIEDMLFLIAQSKLFNLEGDVIVDFFTALKMFTRRIIVQNRVEDVQLSVESYQRKLNLTKSQRTCLLLSVKEPYTLNFDPPGIIYEDKCKKKRLMRVDEIHTFCDRTLQSVHNDPSPKVCRTSAWYNKRQE